MPRSSEQRLIALAERQHQVVTLQQVVDLGIHKNSFYRMVERGGWEPKYRGVYVRSGIEETPPQTAIAAAFACGPRAFASHHTAARVWGFEVPILGRPEVTVDDERRPQPNGITVYRTTRARPSDFTTFRGIPIAAPMRVLIDMAQRLPERDLGISLDYAHRKGLLSIPAMTAYLSHSNSLTRPGAHVLRKLVALRDPDRPLGSTLESKLFHLLDASALPLPVPQHWVDTRKGPRRIDFAYPELKLAIEADGYENHFGIEEFNRDRIRQNEVEELGWGFRRFTWTHVEDFPMEVITTFGIALGLRPIRWVPTGH